MGGEWWFEQLTFRRRYSSSEEGYMRVFTTPRNFKNMFLGLHAAVGGEALKRTSTALDHQRLCLYPLND